MGKVISVYRSVCAPVLQLFKWLAAILQDLAIDGFDLTIRGQRPNETRYPVNCRTQASLAFAQCLFRPLALGQIEDERKALVTSYLEQRGANKHGYAAAVFPKIFFLEELNGAGRVQFPPGTLVDLAPLRRGQLDPVQATQNQVLTVISDDT